jgi:diacylglycerol kinase
MKQWLKIFKPAVRGISLFVKTERNASFHIISAVISLLLALFLQLPWNKLGWVVLAVVLVFVAEMFNTAIEKICNKIEPQIDPQIKDIKDIAAGAVLLAAIFALIIALAVVVPELFNALATWFKPSYNSLINV